MGLAIVGHLGQIIAIVLALLIVVGILIWARWERRRPH
jgi:membrane protein DedA with SNARE-associated domain